MSKPDSKRGAELAADPRWIAGFAAVIAIPLVLQLATALGRVGSRPFDRGLNDWTYEAVIAIAAVAVMARALSCDRDRKAWLAIGIGLCSWAIGDLWFQIAYASKSSIPYPSPADAFYVIQYAAFIVGLRLLGGRLQGTPVFSMALFIWILGIATLWSWLVWDQVAANAAGSTAAVATTLAYPVLDLFLLVSVSVALAARNWRPDPALLILGAGILVMAVADSVYAVRVAGDTYTGRDLGDALWPISAVLMAAGSAFRGYPPGRRDEARDETLARVFAICAALVALAVLVGDHYSRTDTITVILAAATLAAACAQLVVLEQDRRRSMRRAELAEARRAAAMAGALDAVITIDSAGIIREWNAAAERMFGYEASEVTGRNFAEVAVPADVRHGYHETLQYAIEDPRVEPPPQRFEAAALDAGGIRFPIEGALVRVDGRETLFTWFLRDISERRRRELEREQLASIVDASEDAMLSKDLSGRITAWNEAAQRLYGYTAEEAMGKAIYDLIIPRDRQGETRMVMASIQAGKPIAFETRRVTKDGRVLDVAVHAFPLRDVAGTIIGATTMARDVTRRIELEESARLDTEGRLWRERIVTALDRDELVFWGQPVVDAGTGAIHHHELLIRMEREGETIGPGAFLPHAEQTDLITLIDRWAVRKGCEFARERPVAINLSARSLSTPELVSAVEAGIADGAPAANLIFEITETAAVENLEAANELVESLTELGCHVALDDFGTGYGSFTYLKHLPVTELKIDIEFIRGVADNPTDERVVRSIIDVAAIFGMHTVAEGVEDERTLEVLRGLGVDYVQGYLLGRPAKMEPGRRSGTGAPAPA
ncbi:MAG: EAL domain-containing protein [Solirubrobacterales bacterium]